MKMPLHGAGSGQTSVPLQTVVSWQLATTPGIVRLVDRAVAVVVPAIAELDGRLADGWVLGPTVVEVGRPVGIGIELTRIDARVGVGVEHRGEADVQCQEDQELNVRHDDESVAVGIGSAEVGGDARRLVANLSTLQPEGDECFALNVEHARLRVAVDVSWGGEARGACLS